MVASLSIWYKGLRKGDYLYLILSIDIIERRGSDFSIDHEKTKSKRWMRDMWSDFWLKITKVESILGFHTGLNRTLFYLFSSSGITTLTLGSSLEHPSLKYSIVLMENNSVLVKNNFF